MQSIMLQTMETIKKEDTQHWEKISANDITDKGLVCGLFKELLQQQQQQNQLKSEHVYYTTHIKIYIYIHIYIYTYIYIYIKSWVHTDNSNSINYKVSVVTFFILNSFHIFKSIFPASWKMTSVNLKLPTYCMNHLSM